MDTNVNENWLSIIVGFIICVIIIYFIPPTQIQLFMLLVVEVYCFPKYGKYLALSAFVMNLMRYRKNHTSKHNFMGILIPVMAGFAIIFREMMSPVFELLYFLITFMLTYYFLFQRDKICFTVHTDQVCLRTIY